MKNPLIYSFLFVLVLALWVLGDLSLYGYLLNGIPPLDPNIPFEVQIAQEQMPPMHPYSVIIFGLSAGTLIYFFGVICYMIMFRRIPLSLALTGTIFMRITKNGKSTTVKEYGINSKFVLIVALCILVVSSIIVLNTLNDIVTCSFFVATFGVSLGMLLCLAREGSFENVLGGNKNRLCLLHYWKETGRGEKADVMHGKTKLEMAWCKEYVCPKCEKTKYEPQNGYPSMCGQMASYSCG